MRGSSPDGHAVEWRAARAAVVQPGAAPAATDPTWRGTLEAHGAVRPTGPHRASLGTGRTACRRQRERQEGRRRGDARSGQVGGKPLKTHEETPWTFPGANPGATGRGASRRGRRNGMSASDTSCMDAPARGSTTREGGDGTTAGVWQHRCRWTRAVLKRRRGTKPRRGAAIPADESPSHSTGGLPPDRNSPVETADLDAVAEEASDLMRDEPAPVSRAVHAVQGPGGLR
jgi:hypothetical protein